MNDHIADELDDSRGFGSQVSTYSRLLASQTKKLSFDGL